MMKLLRFDIDNGRDNTPRTRNIRVGVVKRPGEKALFPEILPMLDAREAEPGPNQKAGTSGPAAGQIVAHKCVIPLDSELAKSNVVLENAPRLITMAFTYPGGGNRLKNHLRMTREAFEVECEIPEKVLWRYPDGAVVFLKVGMDEVRHSIETGFFEYSQPHPRGPNGEFVLPEPTSTIFSDLSVFGRWDDWILRDMANEYSRARLNSSFTSVSVPTSKAYLGIRVLSMPITSDMASYSDEELEARGCFDRKYGRRIPTNW